MTNREREKEKRFCFEDYLKYVAPTRHATMPFVAEKLLAMFGNKKSKFEKIDFVIKPSL